MYGSTFDSNLTLFASHVTICHTQNLSFLGDIKTLNCNTCHPIFIEYFMLYANAYYFIKVKDVAEDLSDAEPKLKRSQKTIDDYEVSKKKKKDGLER